VDDTTRRMLGLPKAEQRAVREWLARTAAETSDEDMYEPTGNKFDDDWNRWAQAHVNLARSEAQALVEALADEAGAEVGRLAKRVDNLAAKQNSDDLRAEIETLKTAIAELAGEIRDLWAAVEGGNNNDTGKVLLLPFRGRSKNVA
jgi:hypothetical protein